MYRKVSFFNTSLKISNNFQAIRYYIVNLWELYACSDTSASIMLAKYSITFPVVYIVDCFVFISEE